jgi:hypothetical protein
MSKLTKEEMDEAYLEMEMHDLRTFENFCNACDNFDTDECPYRGKVDFSTRWVPLGCTKFID